MRLSFMHTKSFRFITLTVLGLISSSGAMAGTDIWLSNTEIQTLRSNPARTHALVLRCAREIGIIASPVAVFAPPPHYGKEGVVETAMSKHFSSDGSVAFRAALCYVATEDSRYALHAQAIISSWADTITSVSTEQGASEINFDLPQYVLAASMVRNVNTWNDQSFTICLQNLPFHLITAVRYQMILAFG